MLEVFQVQAFCLSKFVDNYCIITSEKRVLNQRVRLLVSSYH